MTRLSALVLVLSTWSTAAASAGDCASEQSNLIARSNCSFDTGVAGWTAAPGDAAAGHEAGEGQPRAGALRAEGGPSGSISIIGPCLAASSGSYEISANIKTASGTPYYCGVHVYQFAGTSCELETGPLVAAARPPEEQWQRVSASSVTDGDTKSLQVRLVCSGRPDFAVLFDDVVLTRL